MAQRRNTAFALAAALLLLGSVCVSAQTDRSDAADAPLPQERHHSWMVGAGTANVLDTYLSPYAYTGTDVKFVRETQRSVGRPNWFGSGPVCFQTLLSIDASAIENPAGNVDGNAGGLHYSMAWLHPLRLPTGRCRIAAGPMASGYVGGIYNERNGNNPAQAKAHIAIELTAQAETDFRLPRWMRLPNRPVRARLQAAAPAVGIAFSPAFGQSYYEAFSLGNYDHNVVMAHPLNAPSARWQFTLDVPLRSSGSATSLRLGYTGAAMQSQFNHLRYHSYTHTFMVGLTKSFVRL